MLWPGGAAKRGDRCSSAAALPSAPRTPAPCRPPTRAALCCTLPQRADAGVRGAAAGGGHPAACVARGVPPAAGPPAARGRRLAARAACNHGWQLMRAAAPRTRAARPCCTANWRVCHFLCKVMRLATHFTAWNGNTPLDGGPGARALVGLRQQQEAQRRRQVGNQLKC